MKDLDDFMCSTKLTVFLAVILIGGCARIVGKMDSSEEYEKKELSKKEVSANVANRTNLHYSAINNDVKLAKAFLKQGDDVNAKDANGNTALILAAKTGRKELCETLIAAGADVNAQNNDGDTALLWAAVRDFGDVAKVLIKANADVNIQEKNGYTALHEAAYNGHLKMSQYLIENGADVTTKTNEGMTALDFASKNNHSETALILLDAEKAQAIKTVAKNSVNVENFAEANQKN